MGADSKKLVLVVDGSSFMGPFWDLLRKEYIEKIIRACGERETNDEQGTHENTEMSLIVYYSHGHNSEFLFQRSSWTKDVNLFLKWINNITFFGGNFLNSAILEALYEAVSMCFQDEVADVKQEIPNSENQADNTNKNSSVGDNLNTIKHDTESNSKNQNRKHVVLISATCPCKLLTPISSLPSYIQLNGSENENPNSNSEDSLQASNSESYFLTDAFAFVKVFNQIPVSFSVVSPKQLPDLKTLYINSRKQMVSDTSLDSFSSNPQHMIFISDQFSSARNALKKFSTETVMKQTSNNSVSIIKPEKPNMGVTTPNATTVQPPSVPNTALKKDSHSSNSHILQSPPSFTSQNIPRPQMPSSTGPWPIPGNPTVPAIPTQSTVQRPGLTPSNSLPSAPHSISHSLSLSASNMPTSNPSSVASMNPGLMNQPSTSGVVSVNQSTLINNNINRVMQSITPVAPSSVTGFSSSSTVNTFKPDSSTVTIDLTESTKPSTGSTTVISTFDSSSSLQTLNPVSAMSKGSPVMNQAGTGLPIQTMGALNQTNMKSNAPVVLQQPVMNPPQLTQSGLVQSGLSQVGMVNSGNLGIQSGMMGGAVSFGVNNPQANLSSMGGNQSVGNMQQVPIPGVSMQQPSLPPFSQQQPQQLHLQPVSQQPLPTSVLPQPIMHSNLQQPLQKPLQPLMQKPMQSHPMMMQQTNMPKPLNQSQILQQQSLQQSHQLQQPQQHQMVQSMQQQQQQQQQQSQHQQQQQQQQPVQQQQQPVQQQQQQMFQPSGQQSIQQPLQQQQQQLQQQQQPLQQQQAQNSLQAQNQQQRPPESSKPQYLKCWEGMLSVHRQGKLTAICKLEAYRQSTSSETLASEWSNNLQIVSIAPNDYFNKKELTKRSEILIFRAITPSNLLNQMSEKKLCAVIQLPNQTLFLACSAEKPGKLIGLLISKNLQIKTQPMGMAPNGMMSVPGKSPAQSSNSPMKNAPSQTTMPNRTQMGATSTQIQNNTSGQNFMP